MLTVGAVAAATHKQNFGRFMSELSGAIESLEKAWNFGAKVGYTIGRTFKGDKSEPTISTETHTSHTKKYGLPLVKKFGSKKAALEHLKSAQKYGRI